MRRAPATPETTKHAASVLQEQLGVLEVQLQKTGEGLSQWERWGGSDGEAEVGGLWRAPFPQQIEAYCATCLVSGSCPPSLETGPNPKANPITSFSPIRRLGGRRLPQRSRHFLPALHYNYRGGTL